MESIINLFLDTLDNKEFKIFTEHYIKFEKVMSEILFNQKYVTLSIDSDIELFDNNDDYEDEYNDRDMDYENYKYGYGYGEREYYDNNSDDDNGFLYGGFTDEWEDYYGSIYN